MSDQSTISDFQPDSCDEPEVYECGICDRTFDSSKGRGIHRSKAHSDAEIKEEMLAEIQRLATELGKTPSQREMDDQGRFSVKAYQNKFGTWNKSLKKADLSLNKEGNVSDADLLAELRRLSDEIGETPTSRDMAEKGKYAPSTYSIAFGSWNDAVREAGLDPTRLREVPDSKLLDELERLTNQLGQPPTVHQMENHGRFGAKTFSTTFGSWNDALREANLEPNKERDVGRSRLIDEIERLKEVSGVVPTAETMREQGRFAVNTYKRNFGSWNDALQAAGYELNNRTNIPESQLLDELKRLKDEIGETPRAIDMEKEGKFGWATYETAFGSWNAALNQAGLSLNNRSNIPKSELLHELNSLYSQLGETPGRRDMDQHGEFGSGAYMSAFGGWNEALQEAGIEPNKRRNVPESELLDAIRSLRDEVGRIPTRSEMNEKGEFSGSAYAHRFGSWNDALIAAGLDPHKILRPSHLDHVVRSTWEADVAELLLNAGVEYKYESLEISYGDGSTYTPDFVTNQYVIEVKGHLYEPDKVMKKARAAMAELDNRQYVVVGTAIPADIHVPWENRGQITELFD
ncbi:hypothetical protein PM022_15260 [Halorubrum ezzemoulense]|uniref:homing endonuclease associated repeat-containing protein n=1 Tax=Halorubrum ezzemoulense TaxID=337243 RepID=UPI00232AAEDB|nr:hypothetical protein [Halorubrum ezzemoulense]MDB2275874.1 hypothetical protein [Halorubrum ezzemoulense]